MGTHCPSIADHTWYRVVCGIFADSTHSLFPSCRAYTVVPEAARTHVFAATAVPTHGSNRSPPIGSTVVNGAANRCKIPDIGSRNSSFSICLYKGWSSDFGQNSNHCANRCKIPDIGSRNSSFSICFFKGWSCDLGHNSNLYFPNGFTHFRRNVSGTPMRSARIAKRTCEAGSFT